MNSKGAVILLLLLSVGLSIALLVRHQKAVEIEQKDVQTIVQLSNVVVETQHNLEEYRAVNSELTNNLSQTRLSADSLSNNLRTVSANLSKAQTEAKAAAEQAAAEIAKRDSRIKELEGQNDDLTKKMTDLNGAITNLETQIKETERKLATSEGDRVFLFSELKRLQSEKAELEKQFNDLALLRDQVKKLKEELSIQRRLEWIRQGIYGRDSQKGAEKLNKGFAPPATNRTNVGLNVELRQNAPAKILSSTNAPATNAPPAKP